MTTDYQKNNYKPEGRRNIARPQTRWGDDFRGGRNRRRGLSLIVDEDDFRNTLYNGSSVNIGKYVASITRL